MEIAGTAENKGGICWYWKVTVQCGKQELAGSGKCRYCISTCIQHRTVIYIVKGRHG
jgi:hypothetical protein